MGARELFDRLCTEVRDDADWDSEFTPSPYHPGRAVSEFVDGVTVAEAVTLLLGVLTGSGPEIPHWAGRDLSYWACAGLEQLGPAAGDAAADVLAERVGARREPLMAAAVALDAIAPTRARELGVHRLPETMTVVTGRYVTLGDAATVEYVEWFVATQADEDVVRLFRDVRLRDRMCRDCPPALAGLLHGLLRGDRGVPVRREAAEILAMAGAGGVTEELIEVLSEGGPLPVGVVERVAAHPASERLVPTLVSVPGVATDLARLIARRRCAGLGTAPAPLRAFLRERHGDGVASAIADLRDETLLAGLLPHLHAGRFRPRDWAALIRAFASFGAQGRAMLDEYGRRHPGIEPVRWAIEEVDRYLTAGGWLEVADRAFRLGQIEPAVEGAFRAYGEVLLFRPSAHAAFQLAWIDRAFGAPVPAERVGWIRSLGFTDERLLADLARPVERPLDGQRSGWDLGSSVRDDPARSARAAEAGLPSLAARWHHDDTLVAAGKAHLEDVRRASAEAAA
jgi:hypothetical protein